MYAKYQLYKSKQFLRRRFFKIFFESLPFSGPQQPIKISDQDEGHLKRSALLNKHFSKNKNETAEIANFHFSHYKSMEAESCHSNQSSYLTGTKNNFFVEANATGTQLLIVIIDVTWNVNACYNEVSYASARSLQMRRSTSSAPWTVSSTCFALVKINKAEFAKSVSTMTCKILLCSHLKSIGILTALVLFS